MMGTGKQGGAGAGRMDIDAEIEQLLALHLLPALPGSQLGRLLHRFGGAHAIIGQSVAMLESVGLDAHTACDVVRLAKSPPQALLPGIEAGLAWLEQRGNYLLSVTDASYPPLLKEIPDPPALLYVTGDPAILNRPALAVVGSRNSTAYGRETALRLSTELAQRGLVICSGLATGIDSQAHVAAVSTNKPTIAVLGNGLADIYPPRNRDLARRIADTSNTNGGALVSELPLAAEPLPSHFPRRNRIISGLSLGVCVVEANLRSGSLITARLALEQNREVFAVPGSVNSQRSRGCHHLLRQGAVLVESANDILEQLESLFHGQMALLGINTGQEKTTTKGRDPGVAGRPDLGALLTTLGQDPVSVDTLVHRTGMGVAELSHKLLELELSGMISKTAGCWQRLNR